MKDDIHIHNGMDYAGLDHSSIKDSSYGREHSADESAGGRSARVLFWSFPEGKGSVQPWRRRLWELQNNTDPE